MQKVEGQKVDAITSLRFIAALVVFLHHYIVYDGYRHLGGEYFFDLAHSPMGALMLEGRFGVTLFFVLSGFLLLVRYYETVFRGTSFRVYWLKRFARIMPLYLFLLSIMAVYYVSQGWSLKDFPIYATLTQGFFSDLKFTGIGTAWSLTVEECFYLLLPLMILPMRWLWPEKKFHWIKFGIVIIFLFGLSHLVFRLGEELHDKQLWDYGGFLREKSDLRLYTIFGRLSDFAFGMVFGMLYMKTRNKVLNIKWLGDAMIVASTIGILAVSYHIFMNLGDGPHFDNLARAVGMQWHMLNAFFSAVIIYFCCSSASYIAYLLSWRPFVYLGEISFALYLIHYNYIAFHLYEFAKVTDMNFWVAIIFLYAILSLVSALCYEMVERPSQHLILDKAGLIKRSVRRPTMLRLLGMGRRTSHERKKDKKKASEAPPPETA